MDQFIVGEIQHVLSLDALKTSHKISIQVNNPDEINNIFDRISYGKGKAYNKIKQNQIQNHFFCLRSCYNSNDR